MSWSVQKNNGVPARRKTARVFADRFSVAPSTLRILSKRGYQEWDATVPESVGHPVAHAYFLRPVRYQQGKEGGVAENSSGPGGGGAGAVCPFDWQMDDERL